MVKHLLNNAGNAIREEWMMCPAAACGSSVSLLCQKWRHLLVLNVEGGRERELEREKGGGEGYSGVSLSIDGPTCPLHGAKPLLHEMRISIYYSNKLS